jgi:hypothetical protein
MITTPDHADALTSPPAFSTVGPNPQGFYGDCDPATGQEGTTFRAEEFNELALNLRTLLTEGNITAVKGNASMVLNAILALIARERPFITVPTTLNVSTTGVANPANPLGGDPFNSVAAALNYLTIFRLNAMVTIAVAAGTYNSTAQIVVQHIDGQFITIQGAARATTILHFTGCPGFLISRSVTILRLTIEGDGSGAGTETSGLYVTSPSVVTITDVITRSFGGYGLFVKSNSQVKVDVFETRLNTGPGVVVQVGGNLQAGTLVAAGNGSFGVWVTGGYLSAGTLTVTGGTQGLRIDAGGRGVVTLLQVTDASDTANAVFVQANSTLIATAGGTPGDWYAQSGVGVAHTFHATDFSFIDSGTRMYGANRSITSPAINTVGNIQSYIRAV